MNYKKYLGLAFLLVTAMSCSQQDLENGNQPIGGGEKLVVGVSPEEAISVAFDDSSVLSDDDVLAMVDRFVKTETTREVNDYKLAINSEFYIELANDNSKTRSIGNEKIKFCTVDITTTDSSTKNYALACADDRYPVVLAFSDGDYENIAGTPVDFMLTRAKAIVLDHIAKVNKIKAELHDKTVAKICKVLDITPAKFNYNNVKSSLYIQPIDIKDIGIETRSTGVLEPGGGFMGGVGPLCNTRYIQGWPCNQFMDETNIAKWSSPQHNKHFPAGCANVALAAICSYLRPNIYSPELQRNINWDILDNCHFDPIFGSKPSEYDPTTPAAIEAGRLLQVLARGTKTKFGEDGGSTSTPNAASYMGSIGVSMFPLTFDMTYQNIRPSLANYQPVYATGTIRKIASRAEGIEGGHAWVIDGFQVRSRYTRMELQNYSCYVHCNFGWIEVDDKYMAPYMNSNGWFLCDYSGSISSFDFSDKILDIDLRCVPNIKLK